VSELAATLREAVAALATRDRALNRFGARHHRYELRAPQSASDLARLEARTGRLPDDVCALLTTFASGGAGPYYGWELGEVYPLPAFRALPVGHLGCGYAAVLALDGDARGSIWIDAHALSVIAPIHPSFTAYYLDWIDRSANNRLLEPFVPPGACALASALGGYLGMHEQRLGLEPGTISGDELRDALSQLGPNAIAIAAGPPLFADDTRVPPCLACAVLLENLGLSAAVVSADGNRPG
jgi:hypothetical protein